MTQYAMLSSTYALLGKFLKGFSGSGRSTPPAYGLLGRTPRRLWPTGLTRHSHCCCCWCCGVFSVVSHEVTPFYQTLQNRANRHIAPETTPTRLRP